MGSWSWAWVIRQSWAVGRACTPWNWRSRKPSCASWQPFWKATVRSYDPSLRPPLRKPQMPAHFLICKVFIIMTLWPHVVKTLEPSTHVQSVEPDIQVKVTEETELNSSAVLPPAASSNCSHENTQYKSTVDIILSQVFSLWKKCIWMSIPTKVFTDSRWFKLYSLNTSNLKESCARPASPPPTPGNDDTDWMIGTVELLVYYE